MHLVDVHTHLDHPQFEKDLPDVLKRAKANGVVAVITQGLDHERNMKLLQLAKLDPMIKVAFGLYPLDAINVKVDPEMDAGDDYSRLTKVSVDDTLDAIEKHKDEIIAIGEVGLDFKFSNDKETQIENLRKLVQLAKKIHKPLIIHSRNAEKEVLDLLEEEKFFRVDMHCFCGSKKLLERGLKMGLMFSIPTNVVRNQQFQQTVEFLPIGHILTETDAPYLGPYKDLRNEPANIRDAVIKIAELKRMTPEETADAIYFNYQKMFL
jgi:TatD DNase family protein